jgi:hypothetical protein
MESPWVLMTPQNVQHMALNLSGNFMLGQSIDMTGFSFTPIGSIASPFNGTLDGNGYTLSNLVIPAGLSIAGLFGQINGSVSNLTISNASVGLTSCANMAGNFCLQQNPEAVLAGNILGTATEITITGATVAGSAAGIAYYAVDGNLTNSSFEGSIDGNAPSTFYIDGSGNTYY